jgi:O-antigen/teichoic acid export membrane protein
MVTLGSFGAVGVLAFVSPTIQAFFIWQAGIGLLYAGTARWAAWGMVGRTTEVQFDSGELKRIWRFSAGMSGIAILAVLLMQLDKVLLSRMVSLEDFGRYMLAGLVANALLVLLTPVFSVIYPRLSALVAIGDTAELIKLYRSGTRLLSATLFPIAIAVAVSSQDLVFLWTGNLELASSVAPIVSLLLIGTAINGVMIFPYALQLAYGATRLAFIVIAVLVTVFAPMIILLVMSYGVVGGALAWALLNSVYLVFGAWMTHRHLLKGMALGWLIRDVGVPLGLALIIVLPGWELAHVKGDHYSNLLLASGLVLLALSVTALTRRTSIATLWRQYQAKE